MGQCHVTQKNTRNWISTFVDHCLFSCCLCIKFWLSLSILNSLLNSPWKTTGQGFDPPLDSMLKFICICTNGPIESFGCLLLKFWLEAWPRLFESWLMLTQVKVDQSVNFSCIKIFLTCVLCGWRLIYLNNKTVPKSKPKFLLILLWHWTTLDPRDVCIYHVFVFV